MTSEFFIMNLWRDLCGLPEMEWNTNPKGLTLEEIRKTNWSEEFDKLANNRMVTGFFRYGQLGKQGMLDRIGYIIKKAEIFKETKNLECLVDIRNVAMAEFVEKKNQPGYYFNSLDDQEHGKRE
jgi:hypothetical protein